MKDKLYKKSFVLMIVTILCQGINLVRDILLARCFGTTTFNDIYLVSQTIVSVIITMINSPMATAFVPVTTKYYVSKNIDERNNFVSKIYSDVFVVAIVLTIIEIIAIDVIVTVAAPGFSGESKKMLKDLVLLQTPITLINILKGVNRGNFQILQKFNISEITCVLPYACMCIYLLLPVPKSIYIVAIILSVGTGISIVPEFVAMHKNGFRFSFSVGVNKDIKAMIILMIAGAITAGIREINVLCDTAVGSLLPVGSITMLTYASKLTVVVVGLVTASISLVGFTNTAKLKNEGNCKEVLEGIADSCNFINFLIIPLSVYIFVFSYDIIKFLYFSQSFDLHSVQVTANIMKLYALGLVGYGFQDVFTRSLHAYKIVRCTIKESAIVVICNIILNILLYRCIGIYGVAIATSISIIVVIPVLANDVRNNIGDFDRKIIYREMIKLWIVSILVGLVVKTLQIIFCNDSVIFWFLETFIFWGVYFGFCYLLKSTVLNELVILVKKSFGGN